MVRRISRTPWPTRCRTLASSGQQHRQLEGQAGKRNIKVITVVEIVADLGLQLDPHGPDGGGNLVAAKELDS